MTGCPDREATQVARDLNGRPLSVGDRVEAWYDSVRYTATVKEIKPHQPGDGDFRRVVLIRDDDRAEVESYSDAIAVMGYGKAER